MTRRSGNLDQILFLRLNYFQSFVKQEIACRPLGARMRSDCRALLK